MAGADLALFFMLELFLRLVTVLENMGSGADRSGHRSLRVWAGNVMVFSILAMSFLLDVWGIGKGVGLPLSSSRPTHYLDLYWSCPVCVPVSQRI